MTRVQWLLFPFLLSFSSESLWAVCANDGLASNINHCISPARSCSTSGVTSEGHHVRAINDPSGRQTVFVCCFHPCSSPSGEISCGPTILGTMGYDGCGGNLRGTRTSTDLEKPVLQCGSIIQTENRVVGEVLPIVGAGFGLSYFSNWVLGRAADHKIQIEVTKDLRPDVTSIDVVIKNEVGTVVDARNYLNAPNITHFYSSNGLEASGRLPIASLPYQVTTTEHRGAVDVPVTSTVFVGGLRSLRLGLGGWLPTIWAFYDRQAQIFYGGDGTRRAVQAQKIPGGYRVTDLDATRVYDFDQTGRLRLIRTPVTGQRIAVFIYTSDGKLSTISTYPGGRTTRFERDSEGRLTAIRSASGKISSLELNADGYLQTFTLPSAATYRMTSSSLGLLLTMEKPSRGTTTLSYDADGNLQEDQHSSGFFQALSTVTGSIAPTKVISGTTMGRVTSVENYTTGSNKDAVQRVNYPDGSEALRTQTSDSETDSLSGTLRRTDFQVHPRFGSMARQLSGVYFPTGQGSRSYYFSNNVSLQDPQDPFSISAWVQRKTSNAQETVVRYSPSSRTYSGTTPMGRVFSVTTDEYERPVRSSYGSLEPVVLSYSNLFLTALTQGDRTVSFTYENSGLLSSVLTPRGRTSYVYDANERVSSIIYPDASAVMFQRDGAGRVTTLGTPRGSLHLFSFDTSGNLLSE